MIGQFVANYQIISVLGEGGMGTVYKAFDPKLQRFVAIKILNDQTSKKSYLRKRFQQEAISQAKLIHPNIVSVLGFIEENEVIGIVMEYVEGETLEDKIQRSKKINLDDSIKIFKQVLQGISYAHKKGFIHRDLKPSNIVIDNNSTAKIMDFGIVKSINETKSLTKFGSNVGTILYMSPEQIKSKKLTIKSDIYSLGLTFYEMLNGKPAFDFNTEYEIMEAQLKNIVPPLNLSNKTETDFVNTLISKATAKNAEHRYENCNEIINELDKFLLYKKPENPQKDFIAKPKKKKIKLSNIIVTGGLALVFIALFIYVIFVVQGMLGEKKNQVNVPDNINIYSGNPTYNLPANFTKISINANSNIQSIRFINDSTGFLCGDNGLVMKTLNSGVDWEIIKINTVKKLNDIIFLNGESGYIVGNDGTIFTTINGGNNWVKVSLNFSNSFSKIYFIKNSKTGFIIGSGGIILKTTDSGKSWGEINLYSSNYLYDISFINNNIGFVVGWEGLLLRTTDSGTTWNKENKISENYLSSVCFSKNGTGIITGGDGIFTSYNSGNNWVKISNNNYSQLSNILKLDDKTFFVCGKQGRILFTQNAGKNWKEINSGVFYSLNSLCLLKNEIFIAGDNGTILLTKLSLN